MHRFMALCLAPIRGVHVTYPPPSPQGRLEACTTRVAPHFSPRASFQRAPKAVLPLSMNLAVSMNRHGDRSRSASITASALSRTFSSTPLLLRAGSGVKGGPTVFVGSFIARPLTLRTARHTNQGAWIAIEKFQ